MLDVATVIMLTGCARRYLARLNDSSHPYNFDEMPDSSEETNAWENPKRMHSRNMHIYSFLNKYNA